MVEEEEEEKKFDGMRRQGGWVARGTDKIRHKVVRWWTKRGEVRGDTCDDGVNLG
jgi:hypothetical protein